MSSKFIKLVVLLSLLVCCGFAGRVLYSRLSQLCRTRERSTSQVDSAIHWITQLVLLVFIRWMVIYLADSVIHLLNNRSRGQLLRGLGLRLGTRDVVHSSRSI